jgi:hypothetical protein
MGVLFGDEAFVPAGGDEIEREAAALEAIGMSPEYALGQARSSWHRDHQADVDDQPEREAREARRATSEANFWRGLRVGEVHTFSEGMDALRAGSLVADELERRAEDRERRRRQEDRPAPSIGQLSGGTMAVPPAEPPASRRARLAARAREIIASGPKPVVKETPEQYAERYCRPSGGDGGVRYRNEVVRRDGGEIISVR